MLNFFANIYNVRKDIIGVGYPFHIIKSLLGGSKLEEDQSRDREVAGSNPALGEPWAGARKNPLLSMAWVPGSRKTGLCPHTMYS